MSSELISDVSSHYGVLVSVLSAGLRLYGTHKMKTSFIQHSRLGDRSFKSSWQWILGFVCVAIALGLESFSFTISTLSLTIPTLMGSTLVFSRIYSSYTNGVVRWSDLGVFGLVTVGISLISISINTDNIVYTSEKLKHLSEKAGTITFGVIDIVAAIVNVYWIHRVSNDEYDDYLVSLVSTPGKALIPEKEYDEHMLDLVNEDMQRQSMELEVEYLLTKPKNASDVKSLVHARREIRSLRRVLNHVVVENSRYGESIISKGEIHMRNFAITWFARTAMYGFVTALWASLLVLMTKAAGEMVESSFDSGWKSEFAVQISLVLIVALVTLIPFTWAVNRGMHEHGNAFASIYKSAFMILCVLQGLFFFEEKDLVTNYFGFLIGVGLVMLCLRFKSVDSTRLVHVEKFVRLARFLCPTMATIDIIAYTDCDELPSMNEAKLHWCRLNSVNTQMTTTHENIDIEEEKTEVDEEMEMIEMGVSRPKSLRKSLSGQDLKSMSTSVAEKALNNRVRGLSHLENIDTFQSVCSQDSIVERNNSADEIPSALDEIRRGSSDFNEGDRSAALEKRRCKTTTHNLLQDHSFEDFAKIYSMPRSVLSPNLTGEVNKYQMFSEPADFKVRGSKYLIDRIKIQCGKPMLRIIGVDLYECDKSIRRHIMSQPSHHAHRYLRSKGVDAWWLFVVNFVVPTGNISAYWTSGTSSSKWVESLPESSLLSRFIKGSDNFRNKRLKLIPKIVSGNWFVRKVVGSKPAILGTKGLGMEYFVTEKYLEIDIDLTTSRVANGIWSVVQRYAESLVVDLAFVIESQHMTELPESLLCSVRFHHVRFMTRNDAAEEEEEEEEKEDVEEKHSLTVLRPSSPTGSIRSVPSTDGDSLLMM